MTVGHTESSYSQGWLRRLAILRRRFTRQRLKKAWELARQSGLRVLFIQIKSHLAYQSKMLPALADESELGAPEPYVEEVWPAENPLVTVVIPCFNYGAFVLEAIDSVQAQTFKDLEIIVVEGGSTDEATLRTLRELDRPGVTVLYQRGRHRVGDNRNFGIRSARGKYICCLDADDILQPTYLEKATFLLEHYGYDVVSTSVRRFGAVDETYDVLPAPTLSDMIEGNHVTTCAVFRRSFWDLVGGYEDTPEAAPFLHEDWRFWIRLASHGARIINIVGEQLFWYRAHAHGSLSNAPGLLPNSVQGKLIRQAEQALITPEALTNSRRRSRQRLRSISGTRNMLRKLPHQQLGHTILLAVPFLVLGGAERLLSEVVRHLGEAGYRIVIVTTLGHSPELADTTPWFEATTAEIYHLPRFLSDRYWHDFVDYLIAAKSVEILWIVGSAFIYEALPDIKQRYPSLLVADLLFNTVGHTSNNRAYSDLIDVNIVESEGVQRWLLARKETPERIRIIPSGVDLQRYTQVARSSHVREALGIEAKQFVAGFSGRLSEEKAPLSVLRIASQIDRDLPVHFIMTGAGLLEHSLRAGIRRQRLQKRVHFVGMVADVRDYLACYDVLLLPSEIDGRPTVVLEALAMGIPIIASAVGGLPELVQHGETGFLCSPGDIPAFVRYVTLLQRDPLLHAHMGKAARRFAEQELGIERMTASYRDVFEGLLRTPTCDPRVV